MSRFYVYKKYIKTLLLVAVFSINIISPLQVFAATTVTTGNATPGADSISFSGSINSGQTIEGRGFEYTLNGQTKTVVDQQYVTGSTIEGGSDPENGNFSSPQGIAKDSSGNIYVSDANNRIQKFSSTGEFIVKWGSYGSGNGQFANPRGIAIDSNNNVYIADSGNNRIQKFNNTGTFISSFGEYGTENSQFSSPSYITFDAAGNMYVSDSGNNRIQKFNSNYQHILSFGSAGVGGGSDAPGVFSYPVGIALDSENNLYVANNNNHRVDKFSDIGTFIQTIGGWGPCDSCFRYPTGISIDESDNLFVTDTRAGRGSSSIKRFNKDGVFKTQISQYGTADGAIQQPEDLVVSNDGESVYVADTDNHRVQKLSIDGAFVQKWGTYDAPGTFSGVSDIVYDPQGNLFVMDSYNNRVQKFDSSGTPVKKWGSYGTGEGQFNYSGKLASDPSGNIFVVDVYGNRIQKFDNNGTYIKQWGSSGLGDGQFSYANGIAADSNGNVYVADTSNNRIQKFDNNGTYIKQWGSSGSGDAEFNNPINMAVDSNNNLYVVDQYNYRIQKFSDEGVYVGQWGSYGDADNQFYSPNDIAVDANNNVSVSDNSLTSIKKYTSSGDYLSKISQQEYQAISNPQIIEFDSQNKLSWSDGTTVKTINGILFGSGNYVINATGLYPEELCDGDLKYRSFAEIGGSRVYGQLKTTELSACSGYDLKLDISLNEPGFVEGENINYTFTTKNIGDSAYEDEGYGLYIVVPDGLDIATLSEENKYECYDYTDYAADIPSFAYHLGSLYYCDIINNGGSISKDASHGVEISFTVASTVSENVKMRAMVESYRQEADSNTIRRALDSTEDIFTKPINNLAVYVGTKPGATSDPSPETEVPAVDNPGSSKQENDVVVPNSTDNKSINIQTPAATKITCSSAIKEADQTKKDDQYEYPEGLVEFCFDTALQNNRVSLTFVTDLKPEQVKGRKYDTARNVYFDIPDAQIVQSTYDNKPALTLSYTIEDNGLLDLNKTLGNIKDPAGLAVIDGSLATTGQSIVSSLTQIGTLLVLGVTGLIVRKRYQTSKRYYGRQ